MSVPGETKADLEKALGYRYLILFCVPFAAAADLVVSAVCSIMKSRGAKDIFEQSPPILLNSWINVGMVFVAVPFAYHPALLIAKRLGQESVDERLLRRVVGHSRGSALGPFYEL
jgi:hypothetical protein